MGILTNMTKCQRNRPGILGLLILAGLPFSSGSALAQQRAVAIPGSVAKEEIPAAQAGAPPLQPPQADQEQEASAPQTLHLLVGRSLVI